jgi:L-serine dehydratase
LSVFDMFRIGIGPSSSHTVGPMRAARTFVAELMSRERVETDSETLPTLVPGTATFAPLRVTVELFGSLGATGRGHSTDRAALLGLAGYEPQSVPADVVESMLDNVHAAGRVTLDGRITVPFDLDHDMIFRPQNVLAFHPNGLRLTAFDADGGVLLSRTYFSIGGGFVVPDPDEATAGEEQEPRSGSSALSGTPPPAASGSGPRTEWGTARSVPHPFTRSDELLGDCSAEDISISELMLRNESTARSREDVEAQLLEIWHAMDSCIEYGCRTDGTLPGGLKARRRAHTLHEALIAEGATDDPLRAMDWVNLYALAVNEENAAGHRVVTAPTNGAAGIVPAVIKYYREFVPDADAAGTVRFLLAAGAIGILIKTNASIAGAEVGCQGEVGSACAMAAAGLAEVLGGTPQQVENAAEIAMEHNLGLTCDPVGGLVQIPCIERNAIGAVKAINAARMALRGDGRHTVSLDAVIETMRQTGQDMHSKYKETSLGGLAVNFIEC